MNLEERFQKYQVKRVWASYHAFFVELSAPGQPLVPRSSSSSMAATTSRLGAPKPGGGGKIPEGMKQILQKDKVKRAWATRAAFFVKLNSNGDDHA